MISDQELLRIRNRCEGVDGEIKIWAKALQEIIDELRSARTVSKIRRGE